MRDSELQRYRVKWLRHFIDLFLVENPDKTQKWIADEMGVDQSRISNLYAGRETITDKTLERILPIIEVFEGEFYAPLYNKMARREEVTPAAKKQRALDTTTKEVVSKRKKSA